MPRATAVAALVLLLLPILPADAQQGPAAGQAAAPAPAPGAAPDAARALTVMLDQLRLCTVLDPAERLPCYDGFAQRYGMTPAAAAAPPAAAEAPPPPTGWRVEIGRSHMSDTPSVILATDAIEAEGPGAQAGVTSFAIRCQEGALNAFTTIAFRTPRAGRRGGALPAVPVTLRVGQGQARQESWDPAANGGAVGLWSTARAAPLVRSLEGQDRLALRVAPPGGQPAVVVFDLTGLDGQMAPLRAACRF
jgi:hypothetical protein